MNGRTAPGPDGWTALQLGLLSLTWWEAAACLWNACIQHGTLLKVWTRAAVKRVQLPFAASCGVRALAALLQPSAPSARSARLALMHASCLLEIRDAPLLFSKISRPFLIAWMSAPFVPSSDVLVRRRKSALVGTGSQRLEPRFARPAPRLSS